MVSIAIAGLGTVGAAVMRQLQQNAETITSRAGQPIVVKAVSARSKGVKRDCDLSTVEWVDEPSALASVPGVDIVVELMGGAEGAARALAEAALTRGKHLVTANKALLATHGAALAQMAESTKAQLSFEAAVAGGIPVIKTLREGLTGDKTDQLSGILNGTCNYILTRMREAKLDFADALIEAQKLGYAEADPTSDIDGHDTANKLALLVALAFGVKPNLSGIQVEGIRAITALDLQFAEELGYRIKLLGTARRSGEGIEQRVGPALVPIHSSLAQVDGALNAVLLRSHFVGDLTLIGKGAGGEPTANAVVSDIIDIARGHQTPAFSLPAARLLPAIPAAPEPKRHYIRLHVTDKPGVVADVSSILRDENISIESLIQRHQSLDNAVPVIMTTYESTSDSMQRALEKIVALPAVRTRPCLLSIED